MTDGASREQLAAWSEALSAVARTGLAFSSNLYEQERFDEVLKIAAEMQAFWDPGVSPDDAVEKWREMVEPGVPGYVTPKVAVGAVVGNDAGELLLVKRSDTGMWLYPTGWADVGYSASEVVAKEVREETGIVVSPRRLIAILDGLRLGFTSVPLYSLVFHCDAIGGELLPHPLEVTDVGWFARDELPQPFAGIDRWADHIFDAIDGKTVEVLFDRPREGK